MSPGHGLPRRVLTEDHRALFDAQPDAKGPCSSSAPEGRLVLCLLPLGDAVNLEELRLTGIDSNLSEDRHQALAERRKLLARVPDLAHSKVPVRAEADVVFAPVRSLIAELAYRFVVLLKLLRMRGRSGLQRSWWLSSGFL